MAAGVIDRLVALSAHEVRRIFRDPFPYLVLLAMPLATVLFISDAFEPLLRGEGFDGASGAEHAVPAMAVMFSFFVVGDIGFSFLDEVRSGTWQRLLLTHARLAELVLAKSIPYVAVVASQQILLLVLASWFLELDLAGLWLRLVMVGVSLGLCVSALGLTVAAVSRSTRQVSAFQTVGAMLMAGVGGALVPIGYAPSWVAAIAPLTPTYWVMSAYRDVVLRRHPAVEVVPECLVLGGFAVVLSLIASTVLARRNAYGLRGSGS